MAVVSTTNVGQRIKTVKIPAPPCSQALSAPVPHQSRRVAKVLRVLFVVLHSLYYCWHKQVKNTSKINLGLRNMSGVQGVPCTLEGYSDDLGVSTPKTESVIDLILGCLSKKLLVKTSLVSAGTSKLKLVADAILIK